ncbi:hypothetical protein AB205_0096780 [Aquarana catesbeiana]|uniref:Uncharacterized protein n=1 Tax=Aquarana catesbeiana TaxID=8400 RepID=A0A2G9QKI2_AQUCT|nr:hypothetical protein AB205_0096780 [Aquarana catesbeiana]
MSVYRDHDEQETMEPLAPSLVKFTHCEKDIYSSFVPQNCPICGENPVSSWNVEQAPVSIPCPFSNAHSEKCSFVLKPTQGRFMGR